MSTRATYHFPEQSLVIYCHHDGYPEFPGACVKLHNMLTAQCKGGLAERFIVGNADEAEVTLCDHGDTEYEYHLSTDDPSGIRLQVYARGSSFDEPMSRTYDGALATWIAQHLADHSELAPIVVCRTSTNGPARTLPLPAVEAMLADRKGTLGGWMAGGMSPDSGNARSVREQIATLEADLAAQGITTADRCRWAA